MNFWNKFQKLPENKKKIVVYSFLAFIVLFFALFMFYEKQTNTIRNKNVEQLNLKEVIPEVNLLQKSLYQQTIQKNRKLEIALSEIKQELQKTKAEITKTKEEQNKTMEEKIKNLQQKMKKLIETTKQNKKQRNIRSLHSPTIENIINSQPKKKNETVRWIGGIQEETQTQKQETQKERKKQSQSEKEETVTLPPSFVSGDLLNGFTAFTSGQGKKEPVRTIIRLDDLAILPNNIKSDLKGCFVIGEAYGDLADERAHVRLLKLSCISKNGKAVIDANVKGWLVDSDGKSGLKGRVVAKFGSFLARYFLAGFFQGFGDAFSSSNFNIQTSATGITQTANPDSAFKIGLGKGIGEAGKGLANFYLRLAKQTLPIIEVGAGKKVTVVFTDTTKLKIQKTCIKGRNGCEQEQNILNFF